MSSLGVPLGVCVLISSHEDASQVGRGPAHETASNLGRLCRPPSAAAACPVPARCRRLGVEGTQVSAEQARGGADATRAQSRPCTVSLVMRFRSTGSDCSNIRLHGQQVAVPSGTVAIVCQAPQSVAALGLWAAEVDSLDLWQLPGWGRPCPAPPAPHPATCWPPLGDGSGGARGVCAPRTCAGSSGPPC